jgi:RNA polymerase sigma-70 factor, ECF subfamily
MQRISDRDLASYVDGLYRYAIVLTRDSADAADLVQETYVAALQAIGELETTNDKKGWLFSRLRSAWLRRLMHRRAERTLPDVEPARATGEPTAASNKPQDSPPVQLQVEQVCEAVQRLPVEYREIIVLREYEELSYQEIAEVVHCSPVTVISRLVTARSNLRTLLAHISQVPSGSGEDPSESHPET